MSDPNGKYLEFPPPAFDKKNYFTGLLHRIYSRQPFLYTDSAGDGLNYWRERILFAVFASSLGLSVLALAPAVYLALTKKLWLLLIVDCFSFTVLVTLLVSRRFGLRSRTIFLLTFTFAIGVVIIGQLGFLSGGTAWLFSFPVFAGILLGLRAALAATLLNAAAIILLAWLANPGQGAEGEFLRSFSRSIAAGANFIFLNTVTAVSVAVLVNGLQAMNRKTAAATAALTEEKAALLKTRERLTNEIMERKRTALDLKESRDAAEIANRAKSEFLSNMNHELRTPLNHIIGFTELVADKYMGELNPKQEESLNYVLQSGHHLLALIEEILDLSNVEAGKATLCLSKVSLRPLVDDSLMLLREKALKHRLQLITEIPDQPESFSADARKMKQILYNLLSNAVKFTPDGGTIRVQIAPDDRFAAVGRGLRFSIIDSGIGLDPGDQDRIFLPFEQADNSTSRPFQGTGLGLTLARKLVELQGGKIWAVSGGEGRGSAFHFVVPLLEGDPPGPENPL